MLKLGETIFISYLDAVLHSSDQQSLITMTQTGVKNSEVSIWLNVIENFDSRSLGCI